MKTQYPIKHDNGTVDKRYAVALEHTGHPTIMHVARFCGDWIGCKDNLTSANLLCIFHKDDRTVQILEG